MCEKRKIAVGIFTLLLFFAAFAEEETAKISAEVPNAGVSADTFFVFGDHSYGILNLPDAPGNIPYLIDGQIENDSKKILLLAGVHRIVWDGGIEYESIDTLAEVNAGEIRNLRLDFIERKATVFLETEPEEAKIFLDGKLAGVGMLFGSFRTGGHNLSVSAQGYYTSEQEIIVLPNRVMKMNIKLEQIPDRDFDGFPDSTDICPDEYGIFDGCPKPKFKHEVRKLSAFWWNYMRNQPFSIEVSVISMQRRVAADKNFRSFISLFNDGPPIGTNYNGVSLFNKFWISKSFFIISAEYGQGFVGLKYKKPYKIAVDDYYLIYNEYGNINPEIVLRSYSGQIGIKAGNKILSVAVLTGYLREKITVSGITKKTADDRSYYSSFSKRNDSWITTARAVVSPKGENFRPSIFAELSMTPVSSYDVSGWINMRCGILLPWRLEKKD